MKALRRLFEAWPNLVSVGYTVMGWPVGIALLTESSILANPDDPHLKLQLAEALAAAGEYADALALCLELVERDRKGTGEKARQTMVAIFQLSPPDSELVTEYQRQLSLVLME